MDTPEKTKKLVSEINKLEKLLVWSEDDLKNSMRTYDTINNEMRRIDIDDLSNRLLSTHILRITINGRIEAKTKKLEEL
jgi:hypothetical protein